MATKKKDSRLENAGVEGYNKPKRTPNHPTKSHVVVAKEGDKVRLFALVSKVFLALPRMRMKQKLNVNVERALKHDMPRTSRRVRCPLHIGLIRSNGENTWKIT